MRHRLDYIIEMNNKRIREIKVALKKSEEFQRKSYRFTVRLYMFYKILFWATLTLLLAAIILV